MFEVYFDPATAVRQVRTPEQEVRWQEQQKLISLLLTLLPDRQPSVTMFELQELLKRANVEPRQARPMVLLEALQMLQHAGLLASTANHRGDTLAQRRYWRVPPASDQGPE
ncbi:MAG: hypothetical protein IMW89_16670 [Ktedonobacteraceae bacterium]|nr:hypothetical protein [Ktedonobacteraceae bacterium]